MIPGGGKHAGLDGVRDVAVLYEISLFIEFSAVASVLIMIGEGEVMSSEPVQAYLSAITPAYRKSQANKKGGRSRPSLRRVACGSAGIIHIELDRMRRHLETHHFGHLQLDIAVDKVIVEDAAGLQEVAVLVKI
jgi:hypothetical protein